MASIKQHADGSLSIFSDGEQKGLFRVGGPASPAAGGGDQNYRGKYTIKIPLNTSGQGSAALAAWQNTSGDRLIVGQTVVDITTAQTTTITISVGQATTNTALGNNLIDAFAAAGITTPFDNITDKGSAGKSRIIVQDQEWVTVSTSAAGSATSFRGNLYLDVIKA